VPNESAGEKREWRMVLIETEMECKRGSFSLCWEPGNNAWWDHFKGRHYLQKILCFGLIFLTLLVLGLLVQMFLFWMYECICISSKPISSLEEKSQLLLKWPKFCTSVVKYDAKILQKVLFRNV